MTLSRRADLAAIFQHLDEADYKFLVSIGMMREDRSLDPDYDEVRKIECGAATYIWGAFSPDLEAYNGNFIRCAEGHLAALIVPSDCGIDDDFLAQHCKDDAAVERLWRLSEQLARI